MRKVLSVYFVIGSLFAAAGCACRTIEINDSSKDWKLHNFQQKYILLTDVLLYESNDSTSILNKPVKVLYEIPKASNIVENYKKNPELYNDLKVNNKPVKIKGIVKAGTLIKRDRFIREKCPSSFLVKATDSTIIYATILTGEFTGQEVSLENFRGAWLIGEEGNMYVYGDFDKTVIQPLFNKP